MAMHNQSKQSFQSVNCSTNGLQVACENLHSVLNEKFYVGTTGLFLRFCSDWPGFIGSKCPEATEINQ